MQERKREIIFRRIAVALMAYAGLFHLPSAMAQTSPPVPCYGNNCVPPPPPVCTMQKTAQACVFAAGSMGIPSNYTVGIAQLHFNTCTGETWYDYGCSPLQPVTKLPSPVMVQKILFNRYIEIRITKVRAVDSSKHQYLNVGSKTYTVNMEYVGEDEYGGQYIGGNVVNERGSVKMFADPSDEDMVVTVVSLAGGIQIRVTTFVDATGNLDGLMSASYKDVLGRTVALYDGFASIPLATPANCINYGDYMECGPVGFNN